MVAIGSFSVGISAQETATPTPPLSSDADILAKISRLTAVPILYNMDTSQVTDIFARGQEMGNRARVFTYIGDSNSTGGDFLRPIGLKRNVCKLGPFADLQETIGFFSVSPEPGVANSFNRSSVAANNGLSTVSAVDPFWADPAVCKGGESPVTCEYHRVKPSVSIIMLGLMDLEYFEVDVYRTFLEQIVQVSIDQGVIPVLTTFPVLLDYPSAEASLWAKSLDLNLAMLDIADTYGIPVINLWAAAQALPNYGIGPDRTHLKAVVGEFCSFDGPEQEVGGTLRNLLTLQALDELRRNVLQPQQQGQG